MAIKIVNLLNQICKKKKETFTAWWTLQFHWKPNRMEHTVNISRINYEFVHSWYYSKKPWTWNVFNNNSFRSDIDSFIRNDRDSTAYRLLSAHILGNLTCDSTHEALELAMKRAISVRGTTNDIKLKREIAGQLKRER